MKEENRSRIKELTQKNKALETISKKKDKELNQQKGELGKYKEKTQKANEESKSRGLKNNTTANAETEIQEKIDNKKKLVNKVCTQYAYEK